eukprot:811767-Prorocentrum_minimum.AAC.1
MPDAASAFYGGALSRSYPSVRGILGLAWAPQLRGWAQWAEKEAEQAQRDAEAWSADAWKNGPRS